MKALRKWVAALLLLATLAAPVCAANVPDIPAVPAKAPSDTAMPLYEETQWYFRWHIDRYQKRLWSITERRWLTDWMDC